MAFQNPQMDDMDPLGLGAETFQFALDGGLPVVVVISRDHAVVF